MSRVNFRQVCRHALPGLLRTASPSPVGKAWKAVTRRTIPYLPSAGGSISRSVLHNSLFLFALCLGWRHQRASLCHRGRHEDEEMMLQAENSVGSRSTSKMLLTAVGGEEKLQAHCWDLVHLLHLPSGKQCLIGMCNPKKLPWRGKLGPPACFRAVVLGFISVLVLASNWWLVCTVM